MGLLEKAAATEFLGEEFATWLYWRSVTGKSKVQLAGVEEFECWFEAPVEMVCDYGEATVITLKGGTPMESPEAHQALRENKQISKANLRVIWRNQTYTFGFRASNFALSGLKLPLPPKVSPSEYLDLRLELFEQFEAFWGGVFNLFLKLRFDEKAWPAERRKIAEWVKGFEIG